MGEEGWGGIIEEQSMRFVDQLDVGDRKRKSLLNPCLRSQWHCNLGRIMQSKKRQKLQLPCVEFKHITLYKLRISQEK